MCCWQNRAQEPWQQPRSAHEIKTGSCATCQEPLAREQMIYRMVCEESRALRGGAAAHLPSLTSSGHLCHSPTPRAPGVSAGDRNSQATGCKQAVMLNQMMLRISRKTEMKMSNLLRCGVLSAERGQRDSRRLFKNRSQGTLLSQWHRSGATAPLGHAALCFL